MSLGYDDLAGMEVQIPGGGGGDGGTGGGLGGAGGGFPNAFDSVAAGSNGGGGNNRNHGSSNNFAAGLRHHRMGAGVGGIGGLVDDGALITDTETVDDGSRSNFTGMTTAGAVNGNGAGRRSKQQQQQQQAKGKSNTTAAKTMAAKGTAKSSGEDLVDKTTTGSDVTATATATGTATGNSKKRKDPPANPTADLEESIRAEAGGQYRRAVAEFEARLETVRRATDQALDGLKTFLDAAVETRIAYARAQHSTDGEAARIARMEPEVQAATAAMMGAGGGTGGGTGGGGGGGGTGGSAAAIAAMMGGMLGGGAMGGAFGGGGFN